MRSDYVYKSTADITVVLVFTSLSFTTSCTHNSQLKGHSFDFLLAFIYLYFFFKHRIEKLYK